jgi:hypothetical protein
MKLLCAILVCATVGAAELPRLAVSPNHRFLITQTPDQAQPFFWLGDTAWELFHRLNRDEALLYLNTRAKQGFNVIQAVAIAELDGHTVTNAYEHLPFTNLDVTKPDAAYWEHVDFIVKEANQRGLYIGFLPTWGSYWHDKPKILFNAQTAESYGEWLGQRYRNSGLVWILGGDRSIDSDEQKDILRAMARGLKRGDGGAHLITFHPPGGSGSSKWLHDEPWLDFNMRQNGHVAEFTGRYDQTRADYDRIPIKPVIDGEPIYEDHPVSFNAKQFGHSIASDVRRPLYWDLFAGACGHTYGNHAVWQMWSPGKNPINNPLMPWNEAIQQPGAEQMQHAKKLMLSRPFFTRIPDDSVIVTDRVPTSVPGAGRYKFSATRDTDGTYAMIYAPIGRAFKVHMDTIKAKKIKAWWFNPRDGKANTIGTFDAKGEHEFTPPDPGELLDWILVLDDAGKKYPPPGAAFLK